MTAMLTSANTPERTSPNPAIDGGVVSPPLRFSIVTPCMNQAQFVEATIRSVLSQEYPALDYCVLDGGSSDGTQEVIARYKHKLACFASSPDQGPYDAINKGFAQTGAEVMGWLNGDDAYLPWTLSLVNEVMSAFPNIEWLTSRFHLFLTESGNPSRCAEHPGFSSKQILRGGTLPGCGWPARAFIQQEGTFWRRSLWHRAGGKLNWEQFPLAADFELWMRFAKLTELYYLDVPLAGFRVHEAQRTSRHMDAYLNEARRAFLLHGGRPRSRPFGWLLKSSGRLLRYFGRLHALASSEQGGMNHVVRNSRTGQWELRPR